MQQVTHGRCITTVAVMLPKTEQPFEHSPSSTIDIAVYSARLSTFALQSSVPGTNHSSSNQYKNTELFYFRTEKRKQNSKIHSVLPSEHKYTQ